ncbi:hypothetical protein CLU88_0537 [Acidovorax sp. 56]|uniref:hypothetical protein n=1 Tax=Acidovorax sp. 56 TaxID=2035205 RepID=UPI000C171333|nr:hypothetical protein [Acidovorax sp. 56]PIF25712.1 hypothetical protein CLU88_0537 [Acidovorax sp. 56]
MSQDPNITLARGLYNACTLATAQIREAQSLAKEIFPGGEASRAEVLGIAQIIATNYAAQLGNKS